MDPNDFKPQFKSNSVFHFIGIIIGLCISFILAGIVERIWGKAGLFTMVGLGGTYTILKKGKRR